MGVIIINSHVTTMLSNYICCPISVIYRVIRAVSSNTVYIIHNFRLVPESVPYMKPFLSKEKVKKKLN